LFSFIFCTFSFSSPISIMIWISRLYKLCTPYFGDSLNKRIIKNLTLECDTLEILVWCQIPGVTLGSFLLLFLIILHISYRSLWYYIIYPGIKHPNSEFWKWSLIMGKLNLALGFSSTVLSISMFLRQMKMFLDFDVCPQTCWFSVVRLMSCWDCPCFCLSLCLGCARCCSI